jgi:hypothetical protein
VCSSYDEMYYTPKTLSFQKLDFLRGGTSPENQLSGIQKFHAKESLVEISGSQIFVNYMASP